MKINDARRWRGGLTLTEVLIAVAVLLALATMTQGTLVGPQGFTRSVGTEMLMNMKKLHLATEQMVLDGATAGDAPLNWPGTNSYAYWVTNLVPAYLGTNDFSRLMSVPVRRQGMMAELQKWWAGPKVTASLVVNTNAVLVYGVSDESEGNVVFLSSANFLNTAAGGVLRTNVEPLKGKCFVVFHKGGDGAILLPKQVGKTNFVGGFVPLCQ